MKNTKIVVIGGLASSLVNFRCELLSRFKECGLEVVACANENDLEVKETLQRKGILYQPVSISRTGVNPLKDLITFWHLYRFLNKHKPQIILSYTIKPVIYGSLAATLAGVNERYSIITGLGYAFTEGGVKRRMIRGLVSILYRLSLRRNKKVFFQNPDDRQLFIENKLVTEKNTVLINGSGVDLNYFMYKPTGHKNVCFLLIARLLKDKGILEYVEAAKILKKRYPQATFSLVGPYDTNPSAIKKDYIDEQVKDGVIDYHGMQKDVRISIEQCSVYVLPSYREGMPRTVLEAMAVGRAVITTDTPGCRETVVEGVNGFLVPPKNIQILADRMEWFLTNPEKIQDMGIAGRKIAEKKFDVHAVNKIILQNMGLSH